MPSVTRSGADSPYRRLTFQPDAEDVHGRVDVAIMRHTAARTIPASYSKRAHTFRAASGNGPASRARLGSKSFVSLDEHSSVPAGFVAEHVSEGGPAGIGHGLGHPRLLQLLSIHIADDDQSVLTNDPGGLFVKVVAAGVRDLGVNRAFPTLIAGALSDPKRDLVFSVVAQGGNRLAVAQGGKLLQAQVDTDGAAPKGQVIWNGALECDVPSPPSVLNEGPRPEFPHDLAGLPKAIAALEVDGGIAVNLRCSGDERYPPQRSPRTEAYPEPWAPSVACSRRDELAAHRLHGVRMQAQLKAAPGCKFDEVESRQPASVAATTPSLFCLPLCNHAEVPDLITGVGVLQEVLAACRILDAELEGQHRHSLDSKAIILPDNPFIVRAAR